MRRRLGRLVVDEREACPPRRRRWWPLGLLLLVVALAAGTLWLSGWVAGRFLPRKLIVRGAVLTPAPEVLAAVDYSQGESVLALWRRAWAFEPEALRWLKDVSVSPRWACVALVTVTERVPVLRVDAGGGAYWLCDDGQLVRCDGEEDESAVFAEVEKLPRVSLPSDPGPGALALADDLLLTAACCEEAIPSLIRLIEVEPDGQFVLHERAGLPIRLGRPEEIPRKVGALFTALRICEPNRGKLKYLDASDPDVFYQKLNTAP